MAECVTSPFCFKLYTQRRPFTERGGFSHQTINFKTVQRKYSRNGCECFHFSTQKTYEPSVFRAPDLKMTHSLRTFPLNCNGIGALVDFDGSTASSLVPVVNQVLLMGSILLTYMAGVIPINKSYTSDQKSNSIKNALGESSDISGSAMKQNDLVESNYVLDVVREKLLNSLKALENEAYAGDTILQYAKKPLSLNAVAEGPKLRLLWAAFLQIEEEVNNNSSVSISVGTDDLFKVFSEVIQRSCHSICAKWLEKEFFLVKGNTDKDRETWYYKAPSPDVISRRSNPL
ncbi:unnamed protein product [Vicia faba]|uniref:Uncharacterized protein n=1 Tax=Vicia faba TaxID=3906 RepID=A0AAV1ARE4_VICFA|nr:unnamed protein product [Vicia faba]